MLEATAQLVRERGYSGTSLNDILAASGAPRGSLYHHFPGGKDELVTEVTRHSIEQVTGALSAILQDEKKPSRAVRKIFSTTSEMLRANDFTQGCPVAPIVLDGMRDIPELSQLCREAFSTWVGLFADSFERAGIHRDRARRLAILVESAIEGAMVIARATSDARPLTAAVDEIAALIDGAVAGSKTKR
jgi:TetR/AcrR family transcriptional repressor of lmrAB and yxaGH operons